MRDQPFSIGNRCGEAKDHKHTTCTHLAASRSTRTRMLQARLVLAVLGTRANNLGRCEPCVALIKLTESAASIFVHHPQARNQRGEEAAKLSPPLFTYTIPPTNSLTFLFSSLIPTVYRPAASTARQFSSPFLSTPSHKFFILPSCTRTYASAPKKKKMPPKKAVKEEKLLLGRPGNSLKSGIVSESPV